jgi:hypothetical protein
MTYRSGGITHPAPKHVKRKTDLSVVIYTIVNSSGEHDLITAFKINKG